MLNALRRGARGWLAKLLIVLLVGSFIFWGVSLGGFGTRDIAEIGDIRVTPQEFDRAYRQEMTRITRQIGRGITPEESLSLGLADSVLSRLIREATIDNKVKALNLNLSDDVLARLIRQDPLFAGPSGRFDRSRFDSIITANRWTEAEYMALRRQENQRDQLLSALTTQLAPPSALIEAMYLHSFEARSMRYFVIPLMDISEIALPDESILRSYYGENAGRFMTAETRAVTFLALTPDAIADPQTISAEQVQAHYDRQAERYGEPEMRRLYQLNLSSAEAVEAAQENLAQDADFNKILEDNGIALDDIDLGFVSISDLIDPAIAKAAFALERDQPSTIIEGRFGPVILMVGAIRAASRSTLEDVEDRIRGELANDVAAREIVELYDSIEDARAGGATLDEIATRFDLKISKIDAIDRSGQDPLGQIVAPSDTPDFLPDLFAAQMGDEFDTLQIGREGFLWFALDGIDVSRERSFEEAQDDIAAAWRTQERDARTQERLEGIKERIAGGESFEAIAGELGLDIEDATGLTRNDNSSWPQPLLQEIFSAKADEAYDVVWAERGHLLFQLTDIVQPAFFGETDQAAQLSASLTRSLDFAIGTEILSQWREDAGGSINRAGMLALIGLSDT